MSKVQVLDQNTANQIAAGEVVEKPASVVKELVENALDAGATKVEVTIFEGGTEFIRVVDNGSGMTAEDAKLAVLRHATSKLRSAEDLLQLGTLGFRGEALPSIASVSNFTLVTRTADENMATCIKIEGGAAPEISETGGNVGTTVVVENLFFNVPARRKFLKSVPTESRYISELLTKLALSCRDVAFRLVNGDKEVLATGGDGDLKTAIRALYGAQVADALLPVALDYQGVKVSGFVSKPTVLKNTRQWQTIFVNGRYITNVMIGKAIEHAYQSMIPKSGFPFAVLNLTMDTTTVDVNVHPQKAEVKFSDEGLIYRAVYHALDNALTKPSVATDNKTNLAVPVGEELNCVQWTQETSGGRGFESKYEEVPIFTPQVADKSNRYTEDSNRYQDIRGKEQGTRYEGNSVNFGDVAEQMHREEVVITNSTSTLNPESSTLNPQSSTLSPQPSALVIWPIGQVDKTFIIAQSATSLYLIDQHAAHERILYDKLVASHEKVDVESLLVPIYIDMDAEDVEVVNNNKDTLLSLGVDAAAAGEKVLRIDALPVDITTDKAEEFLQEIAKYLRDNRNIHAAELRAEVLHMTACKAAIKAGLELNMKQMRDLLMQLMNTTHPFTCPHGRPCMIEITTDELYKMFKRTGF